MNGTIKSGDGIRAFALLFASVAMLGVSPTLAETGPPVVASVSPARGPAAVGTMVTISGDNFAAGASVSIGGVLAEDVSVVDEHTIVARTPAGVAGAVDVAISIKGAESPITAADAFEYRDDVAAFGAAAAPDSAAPGRFGAPFAAAAPTSSNATEIALAENIVQLSNQSFNARFPAAPTLATTRAPAASTPSSAGFSGPSVGAITSWGLNASSGQLGNGLSSASNTPVDIVASTGLNPATVTNVSTTSNGSHACAATSSGAVWCWGLGDSGQLGDGVTYASGNGSLTPVQVSTSGALAGKVVTQVSVSVNHSCAVTGDGKAYCWGDNSGGELGNNPVPGGVSRVPVAVNTTPGSSALSGKTVTAIAAGDRFTCALASDGGVYCWGSNTYGQIGDGTNTARPLPVAVSTASGTSALSGKSVASIDLGEYHACAVATDGGAYCWGNNSYGQLGVNNVSLASSNVPLAVNTASGSSALFNKTVTQVSAGYYHTSATASDGGAYCWGLNNYGQVGDNSTTNRSSPVAVNTTVGVSALSGKAVTGISAGYYHSCATTSDGGVSCWGVDNDSLGAGTPAGLRMLVPIAVSKSGALAGEFVSQAAAGNNYTVAASPACGQGLTLRTGASAVWQMIGSPCANTVIASPTIGSIFGNSGAGQTQFNNAHYNLANKAAGTGWALFRYDAVAARYVLGSLTEALTPGVGYFIESYESGQSGGRLYIDGVDPQISPIATTATQAQGCAVAVGCVAITLGAPSGKAGYNLVGNPFPWAVDWAQVRVRVDGSSSTYTPSQAAGVAASGNAAVAVLSNVIYYWNGVAYDAYTDSGPTIGNMPYFGAVWTQVTAAGSAHAVELLIPAQGTTHS